MKRKEQGLVEYDLVSLPNTLDVDQMVYIMKKHNMIFWDSSNGGKAPHILTTFDQDKLVVDTSDDKGKELLTKIKNLYDGEIY